MNGKQIIIAVAAIWDKRKGLDDIIGLSKIIDGQIIVVGLDEKQKDIIPSSIIAFSRTDSVEELRQLYSIADVFINTTYEDNYPTTNLEASCCGTPVITYRTGGSPESVPAAQVVNKGDLDSVIQNIMKNDLKVMSSDDFDKFTMEKSYLCIYNDY